MSKLETVRALNDTEPQLEIVRGMKALKQDLKRLPEGIAREVMTVIEGLQQDVTEALEAYDKVTAHQRQALDELSQQTTTSVEQTAAKQTAALTKLEASTARIETTLAEISVLPENLVNAGQTLIEAAHRTRPTWWKQVLQLTLVGIVAGGISATAIMLGLSAFEKPAPPNAVQKKTAAWAETLLRKATSEEIELLKEIVARPGK